jgi:hypothetical protein
MEKLRKVLSLATLALFISSPGAAPQAKAPPGPAASAAKVYGQLGEQRSSNLIVRLSGAPSPPIRGPGSLEALVTDTAGKAIDDAELSFDLDMIRMSHGKNLVAAASQGKGRYLGEVRYMMPGAWRVIVRIARPERAPEAFRFEFNVNLR